MLYITEQIDTLHQQVNAQSEAQVIEQLQIAIGEIYQRLNAIESPGDNSPTLQDVELKEPEPAITESQFDEVTTHFDRVLTTQEPEVELTQEEQALADINNQLDALNQKFNTQSETQAIKHLQTALAQLTEQLNTITLRLGDSSTDSNIDLMGLQTALIESNSQLNALHQQVNARPEIQSIEQLGEAIAQLTEQLTTMILCMANASTPLDEDAIKDIHFQLNAMALCLENLPTPPELDFSGIEQALTNINNYVDAKGIEHLESAIAELNNQINAVSIYLDHLPAPSEMDFSGEEEVDIADLQW